MVCHQMRFLSNLEEELLERTKLEWVTKGFLIR